MTHQMKLYPGAASHDSPQNRRWMRQENDRGQDGAAVEPPDATLTAAFAQPRPPATQADARHGAPHR